MRKGPALLVDDAAGRRDDERGIGELELADAVFDRFAAQAADMVFAKRQLLTFCRENHIACMPFETFAEIEAKLAQMDPDALSPRDALAALYELRRLLDD